MYDLLAGKTREVKIGEHGLIFLMDSMPRVVEPGRTADHAITEAARNSYGNSDKKYTPQEDRALIRYLMRKAHTTPVEMVVLKFYIALPIFVARQLVRHRMSTLNEYSLRYKEPKDECFIPDVTEVRKQSKVNKQGSEGQVDTAIADSFTRVTAQTFINARAQYLKDVDAGIGREQARINLPLTTFTYWVWKIDLHNLFRTLSLRMDHHAQKEIRDYGVALYELAEQLAPWAFEAFNDYDTRRDAMVLTGPEVEFFRQLTSWDVSSTVLEKAAPPEALTTRVTLREQEEFQEKLTRLGFDVQAKQLAKWIKKEKERLAAGKGK